MAVMDRYSRPIVSWRLSNTLSANFRIEALEKATQVNGVHGIVNSDQGSQFTRQEFVSTLPSTLGGADYRAHWLVLEQVEHVAPSSP